MLIILGTFVLADGVDRDQFVQERAGALRIWRQEPGCIEYTMGADAMDKSQVLVVEIWDKLESLEAHLKEVHVHAVPTGTDEVVTFDSMHFEVSDVRESTSPFDSPRARTSPVGGTAVRSRRSVRTTSSGPSTLPALV